MSKNHTKLDPLSRKCIFLGYQHGTTEFLLFDLLSGQIFLSRNVTFFEHVFPYHSVSPSDTSSPINDQSLLLPLHHDLPDILLTSAPAIPLIPTVHTNCTPALNLPKTKRSTRTCKALQYLQDYHWNLASSVVSSSFPNSSSLYPLSFILSDNHLSPTHKHYAFTISSTYESSFYSKAVKELVG